MRHCEPDSCTATHKRRLRPWPVSLCLFYSLYKHDALLLSLLSTHECQKLGWALAAGLGGLASVGGEPTLYSILLNWFSLALCLLHWGCRDVGYWGGEGGFAAIRLHSVVGKITCLPDAYIGILRWELILNYPGGHSVLIKPL